MAVSLFRIPGVYPTGAAPGETSGDTFLSCPARPCDTVARMTTADFTPRERDLIRREFACIFGSARSVQDGILVKRWATGPRKGQPKPVAAVQSMLDRALLVLQDEGAYWLKARFTPEGIAALRRMAADKRALHPDDYPKLLQDLQDLAE